MKIFTVIGARPQIIKAAAISRAITTFFKDTVQEIIVHTGQHYDHNMSQTFFDELQIPMPDFNLNIGSGKHGEMTGKMLIELEKLLLQVKPDLLLIYGDTNSTLAGALAAAKLHIPVAHIEAGLRSYNMAMPEELNRIISDHIATWLFVPTTTGEENLKTEGFFTNNPSFPNGPRRAVYNCGDVMYDNSLFFAKIADKQILNHLNVANDKFILATVHRDTNTDNPIRLQAIFEALIEIAETNKLKIILPLHPRTRKLLPLNLSQELHNRIMASESLMIIEPVSFLQMITLEASADMVMTDSGGVQKEAFFFEKPCVIFRNETEWVEIVQNGAAILADANKQEIIKAFQTLSIAKPKFPKLYGDGMAAKYIIQTIVDSLNK